MRAQEEIKRIQSVPLVIGQFMEAIDQKYGNPLLPFLYGVDLRNSTGIVQSSTGSNYVVRILSTLDREKLKPSSSVALHRHSNSLVDILPPEADSSIAMLGAHEKPDVTYADVGGLDMQKQEIREAVELPLTHFDLYKQIGTPSSGLTISYKYSPDEQQASIRLGVSSYTGPQVLARQCLSRPWPTARQQISFEWLVRSSSKSIWVKGLVWCEMFSGWREKTLPPSFSSTR